MNRDSFRTYSLQDQRVSTILSTALAAVEPGMLTRRCLNEVELPPHRRCYVLGFGKAAEAMARAATEEIQDVESALIVTKHSLALREPGASPKLGIGRDIQVVILEAGHPIPDERSLAAGKAVMDFVSGLESDDLLMCLISGGGSALLSLPVSGVSLTDLQILTEECLASGATIEEINVLRRQLDQLKGGGLCGATRASVLGLILSDVIGDRLEAIASGPTTPDPTGPDDAMAVLGKYGIQPPRAVEVALRERTHARAHSAPRLAQNVIIGNCRTAAIAARRQAEVEGFAAEILRTDMQGEAADVGRLLAEDLRSRRAGKAGPFCLVGAGETTVTLDRNGKGGRNQELALAAVNPLDGVSDCLLVSLATDGEDGPTDAAGAVVTGDSRRRASRVGLLPEEHLTRHSSYDFFDALNDLLKPGATGTNVNDLILLAGL